MHSTTTTEFPPLKDLSRIAAENNPSRTAFSDGVDGREVTWSTFDEASNRAANAFGRYVGQGDRVAFLCEGSVDHVTLWNGALKAGCLTSNLHVRGSPRTVRYCIDELRPRVLVVDEEFSAFFAERVADDIGTDLDAVVTIGEPRAEGERSMDAFLDGAPSTVPDVRVRESDVPVVIWTSGTTGRPKGWCLTGRALLTRGLKLATGLGISRNTRRLLALTPSFAAWYTHTMPALLTNAATHFLRNWDPETYLRVIDERSQTMATLVPTMWREIVDHEAFDDYDLSSLERVSAAGERLDETTLRRLREGVCDRVANAYVATESVGTVITDEELSGSRIESVGKPFPGTQIRVVEQGGPPDAVKPSGEVGEIAIKGSDAVAWAWGDTATTEAAFEDGWWYSGDLGYRDEDGYLFLEGRKDFMILSKGIKVYPVPVEERLNAHQGVEEAAVVGTEDEEYGEMVTAIVVRSDPAVTAEELDEWCLASDDLARYERPREYRFVDGPMPRTATGKLDRTAVGRGTDEQ